MIVNWLLLCFIYMQRKDIRKFLAFDRKINLSFLLPQAPFIIDALPRIYFFFGQPIQNRVCWLLFS